ncbi:conserved hypothetical protein [Ricinus communis]|uniref:Uncharacterized protein n=1 Tax=Ricinus communis TaxID=3988 RepID=B9R7N3_RICCO|nr:conserved hypothetical protein [Ricinus communis]
MCKVDVGMEDCSEGVVASIICAVCDVLFRRFNSVLQLVLSLYLGSIRSYYSMCEYKGIHDLNNYVVDLESVEMHGCRSGNDVATFDQ